MNASDLDTQLLDLAVRSAVRGHGHVEPNPMVGCVISDQSGKIISAAHHERFGGSHAEVLALKIAGAASRGATVHVTLEPCNHQGKTPPCVDALIQSGVSRVVVGAADPNPMACGGADRLRDAGIQVDILNHRGSMDLIEPFRMNLLQKRPWITMKWAQTLDGKIASRTGDSKWISSEISRRLVHRERGRVDAILTGIGTVLQDDPRLTARDVRQRRRASRIVMDRSLRTPLDSALLSTIDLAPLLIVADQTLLGTPEEKALSSRGAVVLGFPVVHDEFDLPAVMQFLHESHDISTMMVEAGTGLMSSLVLSKCIDELAVFMAPRLLGDTEGYPPLLNDAARSIADAQQLQLEQIHRRDIDVLMRYRMNT